MKIKVKFAEIEQTLETRFAASEQLLKARFAEEDLTFTPDMGDIVQLPPDHDVPHYKGDYSVTPTVDGKTLKTAQTFLEEDIKIKKIPYFEVSNNSGGDTVYIGNEV